MSKYLFTGIEILLVVAVVGLLGSGFKNFKQSRNLRKSTTIVNDQAQKIKNLVVDKEGLEIELKNTHDAKEKVQKRLDTDVKRDMSIAMFQAKDIQGENATSFTNNHLETLLKFVRTYGGIDMEAEHYKWSMATIARQQKETRAALADRDKYRDQYHELEKTNLQMTADIRVKTSEHAMKTAELKSQMTAFLKNNSWLENVLFFGAIGVGLYFLITVFAGVKMNSARSKAVNYGEGFRRKFNGMNRLVRTFTEVNTDGNETMVALTKAQGINVDNHAKSEYGAQADD